MREVGNRAGQQSCIRNNNARFFECFNFGRADINLFNLPFFSRNDYPVTDFNRTLEQDNDAGNKVIDNILQTETDTDGESGSNQCQIGKIAAHHGYGNYRGNDKTDETETGRQRMADTVIYVHLGQNIVDQTDFQRLDHCQRNEETDDSHQNRQRRNFNFPYLETKEKLFAALQHNIG